MKEKIILSDIQPSSLDPGSEELAQVIISRVGLVPRKRGSTDKMHRPLVELYERTKRANQQKRPEIAVMTVEEMGRFAGITRQTMYEYLNRWIELDVIVKTSYIWEGKVIIGYKLNGPTLEAAFERSFVKLRNNMEMTLKYVQQLQKSLKNEKLSDIQKRKEAGIA